MALLSRILLGDLKLKSFICLLQSAKERRHRLSHLEINWAVLDLNNDVVFKLAVERVKVVVSGFGAFVLRIVRVRPLVIDKATIEDQPAMRLQSPRNYIRGIRMSSLVAGG